MKVVSVKKLPEKLMENYLEMRVYCYFDYSDDAKIAIIWQNPILVMHPGALSINSLQSWPRPIVKVIQSSFSQFGSAQSFT